MGKKTNLNKQAVEQPSKKVVEDSGSPNVDETHQGNPGDKGVSPLDFSVGSVLKNAKPASRSEYIKKLKAKQAERAKLTRGFNV